MINSLSEKVSGTSKLFNEINFSLNDKNHINLKRTNKFYNLGYAFTCTFLNKYKRRKVLENCMGPVI